MKSLHFSGTELFSHQSTDPRLSKLL